MTSLNSQMDKEYVSVRMVSADEKSINIVAPIFDFLVQ